MFATYNVLRLESNANPAGYQPVGVHPNSLLFGGANSNTAIELFVPFEAYSRRPSGLNTTAFGALPNGNRSAGLVEIVSTTLRECVSITEMVSLDAFATTRNSPSAEAAMPLGCNPSGICPKDRPVSKSR